jgi:hypothetical protein
LNIETRPHRFSILVLSDNCFPYGPNQRLELEVAKETLAELFAVRTHEVVRCSVDGHPHPGNNNSILVVELYNPYKNDKGLLEPQRFNFYVKLICLISLLSCPICSIRTEPGRVRHSSASTGQEH